MRITAEYANNVLVAPGDVYDFDKQIGPRTEERGYKLAHGITGPGVLEDVLGGGICQVSTTLFNAAFFAGLEIVERKNHSIYIDHYPKGRDATVSAGSPNMRFRNDTGHYILVRGASNGIVTTFNIYGTDDDRTVSYKTGEFYDVEEMTKITYKASWLGPGTTYIRMSGQDGKKIEVSRTVKAKDGTVIHDNVFISTWKMIPQEVEVGTGSTTTTKPPTTTTKPSSTTTTATTTARQPTHHRVLGRSSATRGPRGGTSADSQFQRPARPLRARSTERRPRRLRYECPGHATTRPRASHLRLRHARP